MRSVLLLVVGTLVATTAARAADGLPPQEPRPVFRSAVARVSVAATVRDRQGRPVTSLTADDFHLYDRGQRREILEFSRDIAPIGIALLTDVSGSMGVADKRTASREAASQLLKWLVPGKDEAGLYAFDRELMEVEPLQPAPGRILDGLDRIDSYGRTSIFDAIAETGRRLVETAGPRRAVVVLTDGYDNASRLTPAQVSGLASSIDVPVYILVVISPLDRAGRSALIAPQLKELETGPLGNLARWTGGEILMPVTPADASLATRQIVQELRHQYLLAFEPGGQPGWHPLEVKTRRSDLIVRARSGYIVPVRTGDRQ